MKITKQQLRKIIKEELANIQESTELNLYTLKNELDDQMHLYTGTWSDLGSWVSMVDSGDEEERATVLARLQDVKKALANAHGIVDKMLVVASSESPENL